jgi:co-chaperonin GroES (HSP10)
MIPFQPLGMWVVISRDPEKATTEGGLVIPERHRVKMARG